MVNGLILTFSPESLLIRGDDIKGSWLAVLSDKIELVGQDEKKRIEVFMPYEVFETLKGMPYFQSKAGDYLRRIRSAPKTAVGSLLWPQYADFDNDLDAPAL